jgi:hypothetical protein
VFFLNNISLKKQTVIFNASCFSDQFFEKKPVLEFKFALINYQPLGQYFLTFDKLTYFGKSAVNIKLAADKMSRMMRRSSSIT